MEEENLIVKIIENDTTFSKVLVFTFPRNSDLSLLFTPKLKNLSLIKFENKVSINLINPQFIEFYNTWIKAIESKFLSLSVSENIIEKFNNEIKDLINIGKKSSEFSINAAKGLYGELLELKQLIISENFDLEEIINAWHRPAPANHDFDLSIKTIEVKTISRTSTTVKISSEYQLEALEDIPLFLKVYRIEYIEKSNIDSLGLIYEEIKQLLPPNLIMLFQMKCAEDEFNEYLGPEYNKLNYKFNVIEEYEFKVNQEEFPRINRNSISKSISKVSYRIDLSSMFLFKV